MTEGGDPSRSVRERLANLARSTGADFQALLVQYAIERLLHRLSISPHADRFVLKGAMLFRVWSGALHRPTLDVDLLGYGDPSPIAVAETLLEIMEIPSPSDGLLFAADSLRAEEIRGGQQYGGVRVRCVAHLGTARIPVQVDVGFGDAVHPAPRQGTLPTLLGHAAPELALYPPETVIGENLQAIVALDLANSRMKDFYDLCVISRRFEFELPTLRTAIAATFERRGTPLPTSLPLGLTSEFSSHPDKRSQWAAFVGRLGLEDVPGDLGEVIDELVAFLWEALAPQAKASGSMRWTPGSGWG